jgi:hypothetical protein
VLRMARQTSIEKGAFQVEEIASAKAWKQEEA